VSLSSIPAPKDFVQNYNKIYFQLEAFFAKTKFRFILKKYKNLVPFGLVVKNKPQRHGVTKEKQRRNKNLSGLMS